MKDKDAPAELNGFRFPPPPTIVVPEWGINLDSAAVDTLPVQGTVSIYQSKNDSKITG